MKQPPATWPSMPAAVEVLAACTLTPSRRSALFCRSRFPDGTWSAPCFLRQRYAGLGLTLGLHTISSISVLQVRLRYAVPCCAVLC